MRNVLAILMVAWVFVGSPAMCLAGVGSHSCVCEDGHGQCSLCESEPCESESSNSPHGCPVDPCRADVCRLEQDELTASERVADMVQDIGSVPPDIILVNAIIAEVVSVQVGLSGSCPPAFPVDEFAAMGLPLLI